MKTETRAGGAVTYGSFSKRYLRPSKFVENVEETIIDSNRFTHLDAQRRALLEAAPWLLLSPIGMGFIIFSKRYPLGLKLFLGVSLVIAAFYLSGENMSAAKLKYHCLRYISSTFIILNFSVIVAAKEIYEKTNKILMNTH